MTEPRGRIALTATDLPTVIDTLGTADFGPALGRYVEAICAADYCCTYRIGHRAVVAVSLSRPDETVARAHVWTYVQGELWRRDPALRRGRDLVQHQSHAVVRMGAADVTDSALRTDVYPELVDRVLICDQRDTGFFSMSLLRWRPSPPFEFAQLARLHAEAPLLMSLVGKHAQVAAKQQDARDSMASLESAEQCFSDMTGMPLRERQVCARIVFGHATSLIGSELSIGVETIKSYRRRAYNRLCVNDERELLLAYFSLWSRWCGQRLQDTTSLV